MKPKSYAASHNDRTDYISGATNCIILYLAQAFALLVSVAHIEKFSILKHWSKWMAGADSTYPKKCGNQLPDTTETCLCDGGGQL